MLNFISGKKTYIVGCVGIAYLWFQVYAGTVTANEAIQGTLVALGAMGLRNGITTEIKKIPTVQSVGGQA